MNITRNVGVMLIGVGIIMVAICLNTTESIAECMGNFFTGHLIEPTVWFLILGTAYTIAGSLFAICGGKKAIA